MSHQSLQVIDWQAPIFSEWDLMSHLPQTGTPCNPEKSVSSWSIAPITAG